MRSSFTWLAAIAAAFLFAAAPAHAGSTPATLPAVPDYPPQSSGVSVMLVPFRMEGDTTSGTWISQAMFEDLRTDIVWKSAATLVQPPASLPDSAAEALQMAQHTGATYVVFGTYRLMGSVLSVNASMTSVADGKVIVPLNIMSDQRSLFQIEDWLSAQMRRVLPAAPAAAAQVNAAETPEPTAPENPPMVFNYYSVPDYTPPDLGYSTPYYYPAYPFGFYGGIGIYGYYPGFYGGYYRNRFGSRGGFSGSPGRGFGSPHVGSFGGGGFRGGGGFSGGFRGGGGGGGHR